MQTSELGQPLGFLPRLLHQRLWRLLAAIAGVTASLRNSVVSHCRCKNKQQELRRAINISGCRRAAGFSPGSESLRGGAGLAALPSCRGAARFGTGEL